MNKKILTFLFATTFGVLVYFVFQKTNMHTTDQVVLIDNNMNTIATTTTMNNIQNTSHPWESFHKPSNEELHKKLSQEQYTVTQEEGTERPFSNEYAENKAVGIYVDIVSGEPLFLSSDKYDSGTG